MLPAPLPAPVVSNLPARYESDRLPAVWNWSGPTLRAFGVPDTIVGKIDRRIPVDDLDWVVAFMLAVRDVCIGELPEEPVVLAGPSCAPLAQSFELPIVGEAELSSIGGSVAAPEAGPLGLRRGVNGRPVHLVVGGAWHHLATVRPQVVSAACPGDLLEALRVAEAWGATLGWVATDDGYQRIDPYLLAGQVRDLLPLVADTNGRPSSSPAEG